MHISRREELLRKFFEKTATPEERIELFDWITNEATGEELSDLIRPLYESCPHDEEILHAEARARILANILGKSATPMPPYPSQRVVQWKSLGIAAVLLIFLGFSFYFRFYSQADKVSVANTQPVISPGTNKAVLLLADGSSIVLDEAKKGKLASVNGTVITKSGEGVLVCRNHSDLSSTDPKKLNRITTPRGGKYEVVLPDGTRVWLNAASSISFPSDFSGKDRKVMMTGEAYFEVAKNKQKPFWVINKNQTIRVLGTHFNINAYEEEEVVRTALVEGSIQVWKTNDATKGRTRGKADGIVLKPGQQSEIQPDRQDIEIKEIDAEAAMAWKNGMFYFNNTGMKSVMAQIARWYNVEVVYLGKIPSDHFSGKIPMNVSLQDLLKMLEWSDVHLKIEGRKIMVEP